MGPSAESSHPSSLRNDADEDLVPGTAVGEYVITRKIGSGAFGDVYAGEHPVIGKKVAIKVLRRQIAADPEMVSRLVAEARAVNKIRQINIVDIFSFGVLEDQQRHYIVMELLEGQTLGALLEKNGKLSIATVITIVQGIAAALDAVHEVGITHRDLKPDNVFLTTTRDGSYFPKLLDFGIAKLLGDDVAHRTSAGIVMGTPRYMSPEQARGRAADPRSDIYALGVMTHEMLTGKPPFLGDSGVDVLVQHVSEPPPPMSTICPDIPKELDAPVLAMLAKRPGDRPASAGEAIAAMVEMTRRAENPHVLESSLDNSEKPTSTRMRILVAMAIVGLGAWGVLRAMQHAPIPPEVVATSPPTSPPEPTTTPSIAPTKLPETISLRLETQPPDVEVWVEDRKLGNSNVPIVLPRNSTPIVMLLKKTGFKELRIEVVPDRNVSRAEILSPLPAKVQATTLPAGKQDPLEKVLGERD